MTGLQLIDGSIYDFPKYYDLVYGSDWRAEFDFLLKAFDRFVPFEVKRLFEPACGTGRLLFRFAKAGFDISGNDLNAKTVDFCNRRLRRYGLAASAFVGDMTSFELSRPVDGAFNTINSFRHLVSAADAKAHLQCMAGALEPGGVYLLGLHLSPAAGNQTCDSETWSATRGHLTVNSSIWLVERNYPQRYERFGMKFDVYTPMKQFQIQNEVKFRTYTAQQIEDLVDSVDELKIVECFDFRYEIETPIKLDSSVEDVVIVLQRV